MPVQYSRHVGLDELHRVEDRQTGRDRTARRIDVQRDILVRIFAFQEQQLRDHQVRHLVVDGTDHEDDAFLEQARVNIVRTLAATALFDHHRHQAEHFSVQRRITVKTSHSISL